MFLSGVRQAYGSFLVDGFDDKLLVVEGDVPDLAPREADLRAQPGGNRDMQSEKHNMHTHTANLPCHSKVCHQVAASMIGIQASETVKPTVLTTLPAFLH